MVCYVAVNGSYERNSKSSKEESWFLEDSEVLQRKNSKEEGTICVALWVLVAETDLQLARINS